MKQKVRVSKEVYEIGRKLEDDIFLMELMKNVLKLNEVDKLSIMGLLTYYARNQTRQEIKTK